MFLFVSGGHICAPQRDVNIQSFIIIWVKRFSEYLAYEISYRPGCWWGLLYIYLLSFPRFWTFCIEWFAFLFFMASQWKQRMDYLDVQHTITVPMINVVLNSCHIYLSRAQESLSKLSNAWNLRHVLLYLGLKKVIPKIVPVTTTTVIILLVNFLSLKFIRNN